MESWRRELLEGARSQLGAAIVQSIPSDDQIIMGHVQTAYDRLKLALADKHTHVAGTTAGRHIDECAVCGHDIRAH